MSWSKDRHRHGLAATGTKTRKIIAPKYFRVDSNIITAPLYGTRTKSQNSMAKIVADTKSPRPTLAIPLMMKIAPDKVRISADAIASIYILLEKYKESPIEPIKTEEFIRQLHETGTVMILIIEDINRFVEGIEYGYTIIKMIDAIDIDDKVKAELKKAAMQVVGTEPLKMVLNGERALKNLYESIDRKDTQHLYDIYEQVIPIEEWPERAIRILDKRYIWEYIDPKIHGLDMRDQLDMMIDYRTILNIEDYKDKFNITDRTVKHLYEKLIIEISRYYIEADTEENKKKARVGGPYPRTGMMLLPLMWMGYMDTIGYKAAPEKMDHPLWTGSPKESGFENTVIKTFALSVISNRYINNQITFMDMVMMTADDEIFKKETPLREWIMFMPGMGGIGLQKKFRTERWEIVRTMFNKYYQSIADMPESTINENNLFKLTMNRKNIIDAYRELKTGNTRRAAKIIHAILKANHIIWEGMKTVDDIEEKLKRTAIYKIHNAARNTSMSRDPIVIYAQIPDKFTPQEKLIITAKQIARNEKNHLYDDIIEQERKAIEDADRAFNALLQ